MRYAWPCVQRILEEGATYEQALTAEAGCLYDVGMAKLETEYEKQKIIQACMMKKGFRWERYVVR